MDSHEGQALAPLQPQRILVSYKLTVVNTSTSWDGSCSMANDAERARPEFVLNTVSNYYFDFGFDRCWADDQQLSPDPSPDQTEPGTRRVFGNEN